MQHIAGKIPMTSAINAGANLAVDIPWKWLNFFLDDDAELETIGKEYSSGQMLTGQVKKRLIEVECVQDKCSLNNLVHLGGFAQQTCLLPECSFWNA